MATIRKIQRQSGVAYKAIIKDRFGHPIKSKTFPKKTDARIWADRIESDQHAIDAYGAKGAKMTFSERVEEYILQWHGKDTIHQQIRAMYWSEQFGQYQLDEVNADKIRAALKALQSGKYKIGNGRGKPLVPPNLSTKPVVILLSTATAPYYQLSSTMPLNKAISH